jgi:predicted TIM-barrel fold metal-dependent hydrolase
MPDGALDLDALVAIDVHVHVEADLHGHLALDDELSAAAAKYFKGDPYHPTVPEIAEDYRGQNMAAVIFTVDTEAATGQPALSNEEIAEAAAQHPDVLIPFGSIDPARGVAGIRAARRLVEAHGVRGFKFHPSIQAFEPNDRAVYPLYEELQSLGVPALFHTGQTGIGAGLPGGRGIKLRYSDPMLLDDVAADFPGLTIILAHPSVPWQDAAISVATHKANVYIDLSGWSPKYFPPQLVRAANTLLKHKVLFGSDYPLLRPDRWIRDFAALDIRDEVRPLIMKQNAIRALHLDNTASDGA